MSWVNEGNNIGIMREQIIKAHIMKEDDMFTAPDDVLEARANVLLAEFDAAGHKLDLFPSVWAALDVFGQWYTQPKFEFATATFQMSIQRKIGADVIALGMTITAPAESREQREHAYFTLEKEIEARFNSIYVKRGRPADSPTPEKAVQNQEVDTFATTRMTHDYVEGKHRIRLCGGRWEKFGVPVYPEIITQLGLTLETIPMGSQPFIGVATCLMKDGKPQKILSFQHAAQQP
jgi:hypothetical protein